MQCSDLSSQMLVFHIPIRRWAGDWLEVLLHRTLSRDIPLQGFLSAQFVFPRFSRHLFTLEEYQLACCYV